MSSYRSHGLAVLAVLVLLIAGTPPAGSYQGKGGFGSGGGSFDGSPRQSVGLLGMQTFGTSGSALYESHEGFIAYFGRPIFDSENGSLDFGSVSTGGSLTLAATVRNYGGLTLQLGEFQFAVYEGSGIFSVTSPSAGALVSPGGSVDIQISFAPDVTTLVRDTLLVTTNDPALPVWALPLSGSGDESSDPLFVSSADSLDFGFVPIDSTATRSFIVQNPGGGDLHVGPLAVSDPAFLVAPDSFTVGAGGQQIVEVQFIPDLASDYRDTLSVPTDAPNMADPFEIRLIGGVPSMLVLVEPSDGELFFSASEDGDPPESGEILITNEGGETLHWMADPAAGPWFTVDPDSGSIQPGNTVTIEATADHTGLGPGTYGHEVQFINVERPVSDQRTVSVTFIVRPFMLHVHAEKNITAAGEPVKVVGATSVAIDSGRIFFRTGGARNFGSMLMSAQSDTALSVSIPGLAFDMRGLEYFVMAYSGGLSVSEPDPSIAMPGRIRVVMENIESGLIPSEQYRMISVPLNTEGADPGEAFKAALGEGGADRWRLGRWSPDPQAYREYPDNLEAPLDAGFGFWLISREAATARVSGISVFPPPGDTLFSITLPSGSGSAWWTQIGHPFAFPVAWSDCYVRDGNGDTYPAGDGPDTGLIENAAYGYEYEGGEGSYRTATVLEPWRGYFVNNLSGSDVELLVPMREATPALKFAGRPALLAAEGEWELRLRARAQGRSSAEVIAGMRVDARDGWDRYDRYGPPPPDRSAPLLVIRNDGGMPVDDPLRADLRKAGPRLTEWEIVVSSSGESEILITIEGAADLPGGTAAYLVDDRSGTVLPVDESTAYRFVPGPAESERVLRLAAGPLPALGAEGYEAAEPEHRFRLAMPHPNPARNETTVRYILPESGNVRLRIYNIGGRLVRDLVDETGVAGEHAATWDGRDGLGREVGPGIYFFRLVQGDRTETTRVVVFR